MNKKTIFALILFAVSIFMSGCTNSNRKVTDETTVNVTTTATISESETVTTTETTPAFDPTLMSTPLMWSAEDTSTGGKIYFLGSIHCGDENTNSYPDYVWNAYNESDSIAVECDIVAYASDIEAQKKSLLDYAYNDGSRISDHIDAELLSNAKKLLGDNDMYTVYYDFYKPALWSDLISGITVDNAEMSSDYGVDRFFINKANDDKKKILEIESVEFQSKMLTGFSDELQELMLRDAVDSALSGEDVEGLKELYTDWKSGNYDLLNTMLFEETDYSEYTEEELVLLDDYNNQLTTERNIGMLDTAVDYLNNGQKVFYIVGTAHFIGYDGIVSLLEDKGYTVELIS